MSEVEAIAIFWFSIIGMKVKQIITLCKVMYYDLILAWLVLQLLIVTYQEEAANLMSISASLASCVMWQYFLKVFTKYLGHLVMFRVMLSHKQLKSDGVSFNAI